VSPSLFNSPSSNPIPNPQEGWLTHTGDGVGATLNATNSGFDTGLAVGVDLLLDMMNSSLDDYLVTVRFDFSNQVNATGNDAYADSEFSVEDSDGEFLFTDLVSDTVYGNQVNDAYPASYGGILTDSYNNTINFFLGAGESETIFGMYTMLGEVYGSGVSTTDFNAFISIESVTNLGGGPDPNAVPIPAALPLFGSGLLALAAIRRRFRG
jgi:hypothetical protein